MIKLTLRTPVFDSVATSCNIPPEPLDNSSRAALTSGSPKKAETLIFPAGTVNENSPFSSASTVPIGIQ